VSYRCIEQDLSIGHLGFAKESVLTIHGIEPIMPEAKSLSDILITIGTSLGNPTIGNMSMQDQIRRAYNLLARHTTLLVLDNFETLSKDEQSHILNFLRKSPITLKIIVTSRERVAEGQIIRLRGLNVEESNALLDGCATKNIQLTHDQNKFLGDLTGDCPALWVQRSQRLLSSQMLDKLSWMLIYPSCNTVSATVGACCGTGMRKTAVHPGVAARRLTRSAERFGD
jgi:hypothetical protein